MTLPTREEAIEAAAAVYLEEKIRIETEKAIARARLAEDDKSCSSQLAVAS